jgi:hypothetical protein
MSKLRTGHTLKRLPVIDTIPDLVVGVRLPKITVSTIDIHARASGRTRVGWIRHVIDNALMVQDERITWTIGRKDGLWCISDGNGNFIYPKTNSIDAAWELRDEMNAKTGGVK